MGGSVTTQAIQHFLDELGGVQGEQPAAPIVRDLLARSVERLHLLCVNLLHRHYPRLTRGPVNLQSEEMLSAVVERLIKAMREIRPQTVRQFFALANQHMRWELNDLARRLDQQTRDFELSEASMPAPAEPSVSEASQSLERMLQAIAALPEDERESFNLVRVGGMSYGEVAQILGCSSKTVQRRLNRSLVLLADALADLQPPSPASQ